MTVQIENQKKNYDIYTGYCQYRIFPFHYFLILEPIIRPISMPKDNPIPVLLKKVEPRATPIHIPMAILSLA